MLQSFSGHVVREHEGEDECLEHTLAHHHRTHVDRAHRLHVPRGVLDEQKLATELFGEILRIEAEHDRRLHLNTMSAAVVRLIALQDERALRVAVLRGFLYGLPELLVVRPLTGLETGMDVLEGAATREDRGEHELGHPGVRLIDTELREGAQSAIESKTNGHGVFLLDAGE